MFNWICENYQLIITAFIACVDVGVLVISLLKRNVKIVDSAFERLLEDLPQLIISAEKSGLTGSKKFGSVMSAAVALFSNFTGKSNAYIVKHYYKRIESSIENILCTPQKKGVN